MHERYSNRRVYFDEQASTTAKYVIPYLKPYFEVGSEVKVLEIGCGEAGNLMPFLEAGCKCVGVDLSPNRIENGKAFYKGHPLESNIELVSSDIYNVGDEWNHQFDLVFLRDVIEHIPNQERFMQVLARFLKPNGVVFFGFPPWQNPFGGHQQICQSKYLSKLPYFHLLPMPLFKGFLKMFNEPEATINGLVEIKETGISIERFRRAYKKANFKPVKETLYFINPNYETKFKLKPRIQSNFIASLPWLRNFLTTCMYSIIRPS